MENNPNLINGQNGNQKSHSAILEFIKSKIWLIVALVLVISVGAFIYYQTPGLGGKTDDWAYNASAFEFEEFFDSLEFGAVIGINVGILLFGFLCVFFGNKLRRKDSKLVKLLGGMLLVVGWLIVGLFSLILLLAGYFVSAYLLMLVNGLQDPNIEIGVVNKYLPSVWMMISLVVLFFGINRFRNKNSEKTKKRGKRLIILSIFLMISTLLGAGMIRGLSDFTMNTTVNSGYSSGSLGLGGSSFGGVTPSVGKGLSQTDLFGGAGLQNNFASPGIMIESESLGFAVGGAKDVNNFRKNIENNYLPIPTDITYEGLFYDYYFDTGKMSECNKLFCPSYSYAVTRDPFSQKEDYYLSVGLNSGMKESDFQRKKLNLVVVLDISGSMGSAFNRYYYDKFGKEKPEDDEDTGKSKMEIAAKSVVGLMDHLQKNDRFGMVLFNNEASLAKPLRLVGKTDMQSIKDHVLEIGDRGGTNMSSGMKMGTEQFNEYLDIDKSEYENRIIFLTDAMPNRGETSEGGLFGMMSDNADNGIYTTFIGIGVDFNTELVEKITKTTGANYYSVHSSSDFKKRLDDEFEYMVTPLVFDLELKLETNGYEIEKVYGSPQANEATGEIMKVSTLFPSKTEGGETRGGLVLLKLKKISPDAQLKLITSYKDRNGIVGGDEAIIQFEESSEYFANSGIEKGVLLSRYADLIKNWIYDERSRIEKPDLVSPIAFFMDRESGIMVPNPGVFQLGRWERQSSLLKVGFHYGELFKEFRTYFQKELSIISDETLQQEIDVLDNLIKIMEPEDLGQEDKVVDDAVERSCTENKGLWLSEFNECEDISRTWCESWGGQFNGCDSVCRHQVAKPGEAISCIDVCVPVCDL